jgi:transmembrane sensor
MTNSAYSREIAKAASMWLARCDAGLDAASEREFTQWLNENPAHKAAWERVNRAWNATLPAVSSGAAPAMIQELGRRRHRRQRRNRLLPAACLALVLGALVVKFRLTETPVSVTGKTALAYSGAEVLRPERRVLEDGTVVELNTGTKIAVSYTQQERKVTLLSGEAHFSVVHNPTCPFEVDAGGVAVHDVGTQFFVRLKPEATEVLVTEGVVKVETTPVASDTPKTASVIVTAGNRLSVPLNDPSASLAAEPASSEETQQWLAWRGPRLVLSDTSLSDAVTALNRENAFQISVADRSLAQMRLSGIFRADNAEGFVRLLETSYGVRVERQDSRVILRSAP